MVNGPNISFKDWIVAFSTERKWGSKDQMRIRWINSSEGRTQTAAGGNLFRSLELELCTAAARSVEKADFKPDPNQTDQH